MKRIIGCMLALSLFTLPACNSNKNADEEYTDTTEIPGFDDMNYNDKNGGTPVNPDTTPGADNTDQLPGNETGTPANTGGGNNSSNRSSGNGSSASNGGTNTTTGSTAKVAGQKPGFQASGQYDSRLTNGRPKPVNTDDRYYKNHPPAHSYGDTAPRHDGVNSVR